MEFSRMNLHIYGPTGGGKTTNALNLCRDHALECGNKNFRTLILDYDNLPASRAEDNVLDHQKGFIENFDVIGILQENKANKGKEKRSKKDTFWAFPKYESIDYNASYHNMLNIFDELKDTISQYNYIVVDSLFPVIRNNIAVAVWLAENPERIAPIEEDWSAITPLRDMTFNHLVMMARRHKIPLIITGRMTDNYLNGDKVGETWSSSREIASAASVRMTISKPEPKKGAGLNIFTVVVDKTPASGVFVDEIKPGERELIDVLKDNGVL